MKSISALHGKKSPSTASGYLCLAFLWIWANSTSVGAEYHIVGTVSTQLIDQQSGRLAENRKDKFEIWMRGCAWLIRVQEISEKTASEPDYIETGADGPRVHTIRSLHGYITSLKPPARDREQNSFEGAVQPTLLPDPWMAPVNRVLWWIYCSSCYLATNQTTKAFPIFYSDDDVAASLHLRGIALPASIELEKSYPQLPARVSCLDEGIRFRCHPDLRYIHDAPVRKEGRSEPFANGFTNSSLEVLSWRQIDAMKLPETAKASRWELVNVPTEETKLIATREYLISAETIENQVTRTSTLPDLKGLTFIADYRFMLDDTESPDVGYLTSGVHWLTDDQLRHTREFITERDAYPQMRRAFRGIDNNQRPARSAGRTVAAIVGIGATCILIFLLSKQTVLSGSAKETK